MVRKRGFRVKVLDTSAPTSAEAVFRKRLRSISKLPVLSGDFSRTMDNSSFLFLFYHQYLQPDTDFTDIHCFSRADTF